MVWKAVKRKNQEEGYEAAEFLDYSDYIYAISNLMDSIDQLSVCYDKPDPNHPVLEFTDCGRHFVVFPGEIIVHTPGDHYRVMPKKAFFKEFYIV